MKTHLGFEAGAIERAHRVGGKRDGAKHPFVVRFLDYQSRRDVIHNAHKLKNVPSLRVSISEDFTPRTRLHRSKLWQFNEQFRERNIKVNLVFDKLYADGKQFCYCP